MGKTRVISKGYRHGTRDKWAEELGAGTVTIRWAMEIRCVGVASSKFEGSFWKSFVAV